MQKLKSLESRPSMYNKLTKTLTAFISDVKLLKHPFEAETLKLIIIFLEYLRKHFIFLIISMFSFAIVFKQVIHGTIEIKLINLNFI